MRKKGRDTTLDNVKTAQGCIPGETFCSTCSRTSEQPLRFASTLNCGSWRDPDTVFSGSRSQFIRGDAIWEEGNLEEFPDAHESWPFDFRRSTSCDLLN